MSNDDIMLEFIRLLIETNGGVCNMSNDELRASSIAPTIVQLLEVQGITFANVAEQGVVIDGVVIEPSTAQHSTAL